MSTKPLGEKLQIKENYIVLLVNAPTGYETLLGKLPPNVKMTKSTAEPVDVVQVFATSKKELEQLKKEGIKWKQRQPGRGMILMLVFSFFAAQ